MSTPRPRPDLDRLAETILGGNPFLANRVLQPSTAGTDAESIHRPEFHRLVELATGARHQRLGIGVVLWGEAGIGKSHLLARLERWAQGKACFVYFHNLQAQAETLPGYVLNCIVSHVTGGRSDRFHETPLFRLLNATLKSAVGSKTPRLTWAQAESAYNRWVQRLIESDPSRAAIVNRTVYQVLFRFFRSAYEASRGAPDDDVARLATLWLAGDALDNPNAERLGIRIANADDSFVSLRDEQILKAVIAAFAQLGWNKGWPLLLCLDQVDNLESEQIAALARFLQALLDTLPNLLVVTAGVQEGLLRFHRDKAIQDSAWDRLAQFEILLQRVSPAEAREIVKVRLDPFLDMFREIPAVAECSRGDALFPLGEAWETEVLRSKPEVRPRDAITWAREGWRREQEALRRVGVTRWLKEWPMRRPAKVSPLPLSANELAALIDDKIEQRLHEHLVDRERNSASLPPDAANLAGLVHTLLQQCLIAEPPYPLEEVRLAFRPRTGTRSNYDVTLRRRLAGGAMQRVGLVFLATAHKSSMTTALRRLLHDSAPPQRVLVITDERRPLRTGTQGDRYLEALERRGPEAFATWSISFREYACLDALQAVVGMARAGDLEVDIGAGRSRRIDEREVIASHQRRGRYSRSPLLRDLLGGQATRTLSESSARHLHAAAP